MKNPILIACFAILLVFPQSSSSEVSFEEADGEFFSGEYRTAISLYEDILEADPQNARALKMLGVSYANLENYKKSLVMFFQVLQQDNYDVMALNGMGAGLGFLGEYHEARKYFARSLEIDSENTITWNYLEFTNKILEKCPYDPTLRPTSQINEIPSWIKQNALWWSQDDISDQEFFDSIKYLIENRVIQINTLPQTQASNTIPDWLKNAALWWSQGLVSDAEFTNGLEYLVQQGIISLSGDSIKNIKKIQADEILRFKTYLVKILQNINKEKRYIEFPNPSQDVIKKFLRDYSKWNFEQQAELGNKYFAEPKTITINDTLIKEYKIFVNEQPSGLPLDHVSTLEDSILFWETQQTGHQITFSYTDLKSDANVWVTWVVRNLGENILGHAHFGKGIVDVALGDYDCDGSFQLYDIDTVEKIMRHELGHSIGLGHSPDSDDIMYPTIEQNYTYCLLV